MIPIKRTNSTLPTEINYILYLFFVMTVQIFKTHPILRLLWHQRLTEFKTSFFSVSKVEWRNICNHMDQLYKHQLNYQIKEKLQHFVSSLLQMYRIILRFFKKNRFHPTSRKWKAYLTQCVKDKKITYNSWSKWANFKTVCVKTTFCLLFFNSVFCWLNGK
jgi:hypothetical protein